MHSSVQLHRHVQCALWLSPGPWLANRVLSHMAAVPQRSSIFGVPFYCMTQIYQIWHGNMWGRSMYLGVSHAKHPKRAEFQGSPILGVLLYLCLHPLMQNNQIRHCNLYGDGRVFRRSATPLHLHKCITRHCCWTAEFLVLRFLQSWRSPCLEIGRESGTA